MELQAERTSSAAAESTVELENHSLLSQSVGEEMVAEEGVQFTSSDDLTKLNEILSELVDLTKEIRREEDTSLTLLPASLPNQLDRELKREQSQINWFLDSNDQSHVFENFDIDLFDNVLIYNTDPMLGEVIRL